MTNTGYPSHTRTEIHYRTETMFWKQKSRFCNFGFWSSVAPKVEILRTFLCTS